MKCLVRDLAGSHHRHGGRSFLCTLVLFSSRCARHCLGVREHCGDPGHNLTWKGLPDELSQLLHNLQHGRLTQPLVGHVWCVIAAKHKRLGKWHKEKKGQLPVRNQLYPDPAADWDSDSC